MSDATPRFALPYIASGQSQKEVTHAEGLNDIDLFLHTTIESASLTVPPASPTEGMIHIVAGSATGAWVGEDGKLAQYLGGVWRFRAPIEGMVVWNKALSLPVRFLGGSWITGVLTANRIDIGGVQVVGTRQAAISAPSGGTTIDSQSRTAISQILTALKNHGLVAP